MFSYIYFASSRLQRVNPVQVLLQIHITSHQIQSYGTSTKLLRSCILLFDPANCVTISLIVSYNCVMVSSIVSCNCITILSVWHCLVFILTVVHPQNQDFLFKCFVVQFATSLCLCTVHVTRSWKAISKNASNLGFNISHFTFDNVIETTAKAWSQESSTSTTDQNTEVLKAAPVAVQTAKNCGVGRPGTQGIELFFTNWWGKLMESVGDSDGTENFPLQHARTMKTILLSFTAK